MSMQERDYWLGFSVFPGIGPKRFAQLLDFFHTAKQAWEADEDSLKAAGLGEKTILNLISFRKKFSLESYVELLKKKEVCFVCANEKEYPQLLTNDSGKSSNEGASRIKESPDSGVTTFPRITYPPFLLYYKGNQSLLNQLPSIGIVGTRKITDYGRQVTELFTQSLVEAGFAIVSGLAMGVDACAHKMTIDLKGKTIAVLGCGVDMCYPRENEKLYQQILEHDGLIVSEYPVTMQPTIGSFPSRNRIIAGLSQALLVTEGTADSGALITAEDSFTLNRPVFAIPGQITSLLAKGPLKLLQRGGKLATGPEDIIRDLGAKDIKSVERAKKKIFKGATKEEQQVIDLLVNENLSFDDILRRMKMNPIKMSSILSLLELKGILVVGREGRYGLNYSS